MVLPTELDRGSLLSAKRLQEPQMRSPRTLTIALGTSALMAVSGVAFAVVQSVDTAPAPQVVIPTSSPRSATPEPGDDRGTARHGADDPAGHDAGDDHGGATSGSDDPATHDLGDDHGGATGGNHDPATHDVADDNGGTRAGGGEDPRGGPRGPRGPRGGRGARGGRGLRGRGGP